ncbi:site-2 protease family protein [Pelolinea submarina]|uniref:Zn-dependent protease n=1 Tax=Pelolinea submarina TaxID=913107 RepID=A0A347ZQB0_9CHLR|nr:site-2 protease family protein [Pelolinea submarina]REG06179.1 Zn-dependent protease [Pelolinea submarina]BBB47491.1 hypothetical protein Pelsub_P0718 [Pelolinea submarina]
MLNQSLPSILSAVITLLIAFTFHEFAHAWTATRLGDDTPRLFGRLSLNPLRHLDFMGSLMLIFTGFGWAKPVPINPHKLRNYSPSALMLTAISGPLANFFLAILAAIVLRTGVVNNIPAVGAFLPTPRYFLLYFLYTNLGLMIFNLLPLPPLDGEEILVYLLPAEWEQKWAAIRPYGPYLLIFLLLVGPMIGFSLVDALISPMIQGLARILIGG